MSPYSLLLIASRPPPVAGQSIATEILIGELEEHGIRYEVVDLSRAFHGRAGWWERVCRLIRVLAFPLQLTRRLRRLPRPTLCYLQLGQGHRAFLRDLPLLAAARWHGIPTILHVHGGGFRRGYDTAPALLRRAVRSAVGKAHRAIVLSSSLREMFHGLLEPDRIRVAANGVQRDLETAARAVPLPPRDRERLTLVYLSNLIDSKGYVQVLEAARMCAERQLPHRFVVAGAKTRDTRVDPDQFIAKHRLTNVDYVGPVDHAAKVEVLRVSDALVFPTNYPIEGQPIVILEAMHFGLAVITTRAGGIADVIHEPENGLFIAPDAPLQIVDAIQRLHTDRRLLASIAAKNRAVAAANYTARAHGHTMLRIFEEAARGTTTRRCG